MDARVDSEVEEAVSKTISRAALEKELRSSVVKSLSRYIDVGKGTTSVPIHESLRVGDVILTRERGRRGGKNPVRIAQSLAGYEDGFATWTHAALYVGDLHIIESIGGFLRELRKAPHTPWRSGVHLRPLTKYSSTHDLRVLRYESPDFDTERRRIAAYAFLEYSIGKRKYDHARVRNLAKSVAWREPDKAGTKHSTKVICSEFVAEAFAIGGGLLAEMYNDLLEKGVPIYPATLAKCDRFREVPVSYYTLER